MKYLTKIYSHRLYQAPFITIPFVSFLISALFATLFSTFFSTLFSTRAYSDPQNSNHITATTTIATGAVSAASVTSFVVAKDVMVMLEHFVRAGRGTHIFLSASLAAALGYIFYKYTSYRGIFLSTPADSSAYRGYLKNNETEATEDSYGHGQDPPPEWKWMFVPHINPDDSQELLDHKFHWDSLKSYSADLFQDRNLVIYRSKLAKLHGKRLGNLVRDQKRLQKSIEVHITADHLYATLLWLYFIRYHRYSAYSYKDVNKRIIKSLTEIFDTHPEMIASDVQKLYDMLQHSFGSLEPYYILDLLFLNAQYTEIYTENPDDHQSVDAYEESTAREESTAHGGNTAYEESTEKWE